LGNVIVHNSMEFLPMTEEQIAAMLAQMQAVATEMKTHVDQSCATLGAKFDSAMAAIEKKRDADDGERKRGEAEQVAADEAGSRQVRNEEMRADAVGRGEFASLSRSVAELAKRNTRPMADLDAYADAQAKADSVMRLHGERAEPPMSGEDIVAYNIRLARKMQPHSKTWKGVELSLMTADRQAFNIALDGIRADAMQAGLNPVHLPEFQHRKIVKTSPGGHTITEFVGTGTIFKQMSRPVRHVKFIGTRGTAHY
jgi:hypothetical protein